MKVHPFQSSGFRWVNLHHYISVLFGIVKPFMSDATKKKIVMVSGSCNKVWAAAAAAASAKLAADAAAKIEVGMCNRGL